MAEREVRLLLVAHVGDDDDDDDDGNKNGCIDFALRVGMMARDDDEIDVKAAAGVIVDDDATLATSAISAARDAMLAIVF
jgi:hypothetical protein